MHQSRGTTARRALGVVVAVVVMVGSAGCTGDPEPTSTSTSTPDVTGDASPTPSPTPTPTPDASVKPERPAAMDTADSAGAEAVAVYFLELYPYVYATNDLEEWQALSHEECIFCASVATNVEEQVAAGRHSVGGLSEFMSVLSTEVDPGRWWSVDIELTQEPSQTVDEFGHVVEGFPETKSYRMNLAVVFEGGQWIVRELSHERID